MNPDEQLQEYRENLRRHVKDIYGLAEKIRKLKQDVTDRVEIPLASDMAERVEELIQIKGIADDIRKLSAHKSREEVAIHVARKTAELVRDRGKKEALSKSVRVGLAILTEGILVAPLEGIADVDIRKNRDGSEYASIVYSGPIRGAGGTAQALSVLIADIVRRDLGIGSFRARDDEVDRYIEEIEAYNRVKHLQYLPTPDEIALVVRNSPILIDGEGSEEVEVSGHRDMERITTNRIRGGMCLVLCEGLIQKSRKILKYTSVFGVKDWNFLEKIQGKKTDEHSDQGKSEKFLKDIIAGRPIFSHPGRPGGFRLRYGRSRVSGLAAASVHPATMYILDRFPAIGSQLKVELPGKAAALTPCDEIEGPMVLLDDDTHIRINTVEEAKAVQSRIKEITDIGEILISYGDFLENNHRLEKPSFSREWWDAIAEKTPETKMYAGTVPSEEEAIQLSRKYGIPLHPEYNLFWHDISRDEFFTLRNALSASPLHDGSLRIQNDDRTKNILIKLGVEFTVNDDSIIPKKSRVLLACAGLDQQKNLLPAEKSNGGDVVDLVREISGMVIKAKSPTRIGARMGRPEKAGERKMRPKVHVLFPLENYGSVRRSFKNARKTVGGKIEVEIAQRKCESCGAVTVQPLCHLCGGVTRDMNHTDRITLNIDNLLRQAEERIGISLSSLKEEMKGVKKLMSSRKVCEPVEKGILRAKHDVTINKDGTCRFDMTDIPITHFRAEEIGARPEILESLGYHEGLNEIFPQDIIIPRKAAEFLLRVSQYIDDLLVKYYHVEPFYNCSEPEDLIGHLVIGLAPHTSGGIIGRIVGFTDANGCYAHPLFHAAKRRNCDGDEDSVMLLLDGLINFSREYLPSTRGGMMDAPLVLTTLLNPDEVDKEAMNVDTLSRYPLEFYNAAEKNVLPSTIEDIMMPLKKHITKTGTLMKLGYTHDTSNINAGVLISSYKTIGSMEEKIERQLSLAKRIAAVDADDVATRVLNSHFLPDIYGNFRKFFSQEFRCIECNTKFRRIPLSGRCTKCGSDRIKLTIYPRSIVKYLKETIYVSENFKLPEYLQKRIELLIDTINSTFPEQSSDEDEEKPDLYAEPENGHNEDLFAFEG